MKLTKFDLWTAFGGPGIVGLTLNVLAVIHYCMWRMGGYTEEARSSSLAMTEIYLLIFLVVIIALQPLFGIYYLIRRRWWRLLLVLATVVLCLLLWLSALSIDQRTLAVTR